MQQVRADRILSVMTIARSAIIDPTRPGAYHIISRCVRRAFLCGDEAEHRRAWLEHSLSIFSRAFAVDVLVQFLASSHPRCTAGTASLARGSPSTPVEGYRRAMPVLAFAIMSNHFHVVVRTDPERVQPWSPTKWCTAGA